MSLILFKGVVYIKRCRSYVVAGDWRKGDSIGDKLELDGCRERPKFLCSFM